MRNVFEQPLHARFVEIAPETWPEDGIATTVEILGCYHPYREYHQLRTVLCHYDPYHEYDQLAAE